MALQHLLVHSKGALAFRRAVTGWAIFMKFGIKGRWYPKMARREQSSFRFLGI